LPMGKWYIAVTSYDASENESEFSDEVSWPIQVFTPEPGEPIPSGSPYTIFWYGSSLVSSFKLSYSVDGGATWKMIKDDLTGTRSYDWDVPTPVKNKRNCLLKVTGFDEGKRKLAADTSDAAFKIEVITLTSPNGGEMMTPGDAVAVAWQTHGNPMDVAKTKVLFTKDGGTTWSTIFADSGNPEGFVWEVPPVNKLRKKCKLRVILKDSHGSTVAADSSDDFFEIRPAQ
jgi:hypothetical protein